MGEVLSAEPRPGDDLVEVAFAEDPVEAGAMQGLLEQGEIPSMLQPARVEGPTLLAGAYLRPGPQRVLVRAGQAEAARQLLTETWGEVEPDAVDDSANARHLADAEGRGPRGYGLIGAYARIWIWIWSLAAFGALFGVFMLVHAL